MPTRTVTSGLQEQGFRVLRFRRKMLGDSVNGTGPLRGYAQMDSPYVEFGSSRWTARHFELSVRLRCSRPTLGMEDRRKCCGSFVETREFPRKIAQVSVKVVPTFRITHCLSAPDRNLAQVGLSPSRANPSRFARSPSPSLLRSESSPQGGKVRRAHGHAPRARRPSIQAPAVLASRLSTLFRVMRHVPSPYAPLTQVGVSEGSSPCR